MGSADDIVSADLLHTSEPLGFSVHKLWVWHCCMALCSILRAQARDQSTLQQSDGAIIRGPTAQKAIALAFTGHEFGEGGEVILAELKRHNAKASFFLTGDFLDNTNFKPLVARIIKDGHYLGPHSDKHLLYCSWDAPKTTLISKAQFVDDLENNLRKIESFGVSRAQIRYFLPPFEHNNKQIAAWTAELGLTLINYTPGTRSNADYTEESEKNFVPSATILKSIFDRAQSDPQGLNGFILLLHIGSGPGRKDKFHTRFGEMLDRLSADGYRFVRVDKMLGGGEKVKSVNSVK